MRKVIVRVEQTTTYVIDYEFPTNVIDNNTFVYANDVKLMIENGDYIAVEQSPFILKTAILTDGTDLKIAGGDGPK